MVKSFVAFLIRFRVIGLIVMIVLTGFFASQIARMEMYTRFLDLFPHNHPFVQVHERYNRWFGSAYQATLMLEVNEGDVFNVKR